MLDIVDIQLLLEVPLEHLIRFHQLLFEQFVGARTLALLLALVHLGLLPFPSFSLEHHFVCPFVGLDVLDLAGFGPASVLGLVQTNP